MNLEDCKVGQRVHFKHAATGNEDFYTLTVVPVDGLPDAVLGVNDQGETGLLFLEEISPLGD